MEYLIFTAAMLLSFAAAYFKLYLLSGLVLIAAGVALYGIFYKRSGMLLFPAALFSLSWVGGIGVSALKLSKLQTDWELRTWLCFAAAYFAFLPAFSRAAKARRVRTEADGPSGTAAAVYARTAERIFRAMLAVTLISAAAFVFEAVKLAYIPLFTEDTPHAYSYFHVSGVHYFTVSCVLVPALMVLYLDSLKKHCESVRSDLLGKPFLACLHEMGRLGYGAKLAAVFGLTFVSFLIPILCVSRFQLIFAAALAVFTKAALCGSLRFTKKNVAAGALLLCLLIPLYVLLTIARAHDVAYLNGIFEMKNADTPIFFTQPYIYIANNFDNFNCLVRDLPDGGHTLGLRMLFPLWALTGLKFVFPALVNFPLYLTKTELTTVTLFYDAYYDFGFLGVLFFGALLGFLYGVFVRRTKLFSGAKNPAVYLIYAQLAFYLLFSFFTTWYSNPTTWFYLAVSVLIYLYLERTSA